MSAKKKSFTGGVDSLLGGADRKEEAPQKVRIRKPGRPTTRTSPTTRATFILEEETLEKFKAIAYWERLHISQQLRNLMADYVKAYEKKHGPVKPIENR